MTRSKEEWGRLLKTAEEKEIMARLLDKAVLAGKSYQPQVTDFLDPHLQDIAAQILDQIPEIVWETEGGHPLAERRRILLSREGIETAEPEQYIKLLAWEGRFAGVKVTHRDFLGALLGAGIKREKLGDVWVLETGCAAAVAAEIADYLELQEIRVRGVPLVVRRIETAELALPKQEGKTITTTVAALRLDAVAAAGFSSSRAKLAREITAGRMRVNWQDVTKLDHQLQEGDVISGRGRGRVILKTVSGTSHKGRIKVVLERLL